MAEIEKTAPQTQEVWTAQDFRERNERKAAEMKEMAKDTVKSNIIPKCIEKINNAYASADEKIVSITISSIAHCLNKYERDFVKEWAESLGYKAKESEKEIILIIPDEPAIDEPKVEKYEDS